MEGVIRVSSPFCVPPSVLRLVALPSRRSPTRSSLGSEFYGRLHGLGRRANRGFVGEAVVLVVALLSLRAHSGFGSGQAGVVSL